MEHELRHLEDHLNTPRPRTRPLGPSPQLQRLRRRKEEEYPEEEDYVWNTKHFNNATTDWNQDEWDDFAYFMNAIKHKHEATTEDMIPHFAGTRRAEVDEMERAIVASRHLLGPELIMLGRLKRNGSKQTITWNRYEFYLAKHWSRPEWIKFVECVHEIADGRYTKHGTRTPQMNKFLDTYPVQVFKMNKGAMRDYIDNLSEHYEREVLGRDNVMAHEEKVLNRDGHSTTLKRKMQEFTQGTLPVPAFLENKYLKYRPSKDPSDRPTIHPKKSTPMIVD